MPNCVTVDYHCFKPYSVTRAVARMLIGGGGGGGYTQLIQLRLSFQKRKL